MAKKRTILVCGLNPAWQKTLHFRSLIPGGVNRAYAVERTASGKGINFCRAAKTWGKARTMLLQFAGGETGKKLAAVLECEKLRHTTVFSSAATRVCSTVIAEDPPSVTELIEPNEPVPGAAAGEMRTAAFQALDQTDALALCGTCPPGITTDFYAELTAAARRRHKFVLLDSFRNVGKALAQGVSLLKINREELLALTGQHELSAAFAFCRKQWPRTMAAVTDGAAAAFFFDTEKLWRLAVPEIAGVVNPIGAGDSCSAVTCSEMLSGSAPVEAFQLGLCAASASCLTPSAADYDPARALAFRDTLPKPEALKSVN